MCLCIDATAVLLATSKAPFSLIFSIVNGVFVSDLFTKD